MALVRRLPAVETLGSVTTICADKTGTLTRNEMRVERVWGDGGELSEAPRFAEASPAWKWFLLNATLNSDVHLEEGGRRVGDPTELALDLAARGSGCDREKLLEEWVRVSERPFDADRKCMTTVYQSPEGLVAFTKGAPEVVLPRCTRGSDEARLADDDRGAILAEAERLAGMGHRVLAFALRRLPGSPELPGHSALPGDPGPPGHSGLPEDLESELTFLALAALIDPPRDEVPTSVKRCRAAGMTPIMITGDHPGTARAIADRLGITEQDDLVMTGSELQRLSDAELVEVVDRIRVYARVTPEQKIKIVRALQQRGEFVAMTGDGVNDAPALRRADIGVAMGRKGTDVAREAADMVLLDDDFSTIVTAVAEGRRIFDNVRKFIRYTLTSNSGEIWTLFLAPFLGLPIPLLPIHILWINLVTDGLPGLALATEPPERGLMSRPPRPPGESLFAHGLWQHMLWVGLLIGGLSLGAQSWAYHGGRENWQTMVFTVLTVSQLFHALAIRSERESLLRQGLTSNLPLLGAVVLTLLLQLAVIYVPFLNPVFKTEPLTLGELALCLAISSLTLVAVEIEKWLVRGGRLYRVG